MVAHAIADLELLAIPCPPPVHAQEFPARGNLLSASKLLPTQTSVRCFTIRDCPRRSRPTGKQSSGCESSRSRRDDVADRRTKKRRGGECSGKVCTRERANPQRAVWNHRHGPGPFCLRLGIECCANRHTLCDGERNILLARVERLRSRAPNRRPYI